MRACINIFFITFDRECNLQNVLTGITESVGRERVGFSLTVTFDLYCQTTKACPQARDRRTLCVSVCVCLHVNFGLLVFVCFIPEHVCVHLKVTEKHKASFVAALRSVS